MAEKLLELFREQNKKKPPGGLRNCLTDGKRQTDGFFFREKSFIIGKKFRRSMVFLFTTVNRNLKYGE
jgi:hypothetical protein